MNTLDKAHTDVATAWIRSQITDTQSRRYTERLNNGEAPYKVISDMRKVQR